MRKILIALSVPLVMLAVASPAMARPGISDGGPFDQARYSQCFGKTLAKIIQDAARNPNVAGRTAAITGARVAADKACQPKKENYTVSQAVTLPPHQSVTLTLSCRPGDKALDHNNETGQDGDGQVEPFGEGSYRFLIENATANEITVYPAITCMPA